MRLVRISRVWTQRQITEGDEIPRGWGVAYPSVTKYAAVIMPIPLNLVVSWARSLWVWSLNASGCVSRIEREAEERGYKRGYVEACDDFAVLPPKEYRKLTKPVPPPGRVVRENSW